MVNDLPDVVGEQVKSLNLPWSVPFTVPRSNLYGKRVAHQECLTANLQALLARRASEYHVKLLIAHTRTHTLITSSVDLLFPDTNEITLNI